MNREQPIAVDKSTLGGALRNAPLRIPNHQREYSWTGTRVKKLFDDIHSAMVKRQTSYFLGTIVLTPGVPGEPPSVVDGQQRLATTSIFLAAVRDALYELNKQADANSVEQDFLFMYDRHAKEQVPRLLMNVDDRQYMRERVLDRATDRKADVTQRFYSHKLIDQAATIAAERVRTITKNADTAAGKVDALNAWLDFIDHSAIVVMLTPPNAARAWQMFKTLNDRAQRTTQADMIKNLLFEHAADRVEEAQSKWSTVRSTIETLGSAQREDPLLTYLHTVSIAYNGPIQADDIFEKMEEQVTSRAESLKFLEALANYAGDYAAIVTPSHAKWGKYDARVRTYIDNISQDIKMTFIRPLLLAVAAHLSPTEARTALRNIVSWVVRYLIAGGSRSGVTEKRIGETANALKRRDIKAADALHDAMVGVVPSDTRFRTAFLNKTLTIGRQARFVLWELEDQRRRGTEDALNSPVTDVSVLSLEHILPKNPAARGWDHIPAEQRNVLRYRIGNLALINSKDNGAIGDKPFAEKRAVLKKSQNLLLTRDIVERTEKNPDLWDQTHIAARQEMLADLALLRWPLKAKK